MKYKILVIDDEADFCELFEDFIADDFDVTTETDPAKALELLTDTSYSLILTDLTLPVIEGSEIVKQSILIAPSRPVLVMSGHDEHNQHVREAMDAGAIKLLKKPFTDWTAIPKILMSHIKS